MSVSIREQFDTHKFVKKLVDAEMKEEQAEVLADQQLAILETQIATRADILVTQKELEKKIDSSQSKILTWLGIAVAILAAIISLK